VLLREKRKMNDFDNLLKAIITGFVGIMFLTALAPIVAQSVAESFTSLGVFMIILAIIIAVISAFTKIIGPLAR
jgi:hypothetical protein